MEMVFNNKAILKIMGVETTKDLQGLLTRPLFVNRDHGTTLSLIATSNSRYSNDLLGQAYIYSRKSTLEKVQTKRTICFSRKEVIFNS